MEERDKNGNDSKSHNVKQTSSWFSEITWLCINPTPLKYFVGVVIIYLQAQYLE
jgi:hypothetical protein